MILAKFTRLIHFQQQQSFATKYSQTYVEATGLFVSLLTCFIHPRATAATYAQNSHYTVNQKPAVKR